MALGFLTYKEVWETLEELWQRRSRCKEGGLVEKVWLGEMEYRQALEIQLDHVERRARGKIPDTLLLVIHPHVYTLGRGGHESNLLVSSDLLRKEGIPVERVSRGGDITYHGPGQLVGYPIVLLAQPDVHRYVRALESVLIDAIGRFGVPGRSVSGLTGVWTGEKKIASIGIAIRRRVTYHGFALNVNTDLSYFRRIHLCGLKGKKPTSMSEFLGKPVAMEPIRDAIGEECWRQLGGLA